MEDIDKMNNPGDMVDLLCANCCDPVSQLDLLLDPEIENNRRANTMLSMIYKLDYLELLSKSNQGEEDYRLCSTCSPLLNELCNLYEKFNGLRRLESLLAKKINLLDSTIEGYKTPQNDLTEIVRQENEICSTQNLQDIDIFLRQDIFSQEGQNLLMDLEEKQSQQTPKNFREYQNLGKESSTKDCVMKPGPWVRINKLEDISFEALGYAPASLLGNLEEASTYDDEWDANNNFSDDDSDLNVEHEMKLFKDPVIIETGTEILEFDGSTKPTRPCRVSSRKRTFTSQPQVEEGRPKQRKTVSSKKNAKKQPKSKRVSTKKSEQVDDDFDDFMNSIGIIEPFPPPPPASGLEIVKQFLENKNNKQNGRLTKMKRGRNSCGKCGRKFRSKSGLKYHDLKCGLPTEDSTESFVCSEPNCGKEFSSKRNLRAHSIVHGERNFPCDKCTNKSFKSRIALRNHIQNKHQQQDESTRVQCPECPSVLKNDTALKYHYERKHTLEGNLKYKEHSKKTEARRKERRLAATVDGFCCTICNVDYQTKNRLSKHRLTEHPDLFVQKLTVCDLCGKSFRGSYQLRKHQTFTHTDERPYMCDLCGRGYKSMDNLREHQKIVHDDAARAKYNEYTRLKNKKRKLLDMALAEKKKAAQNIMDNPLPPIIIDTMNNNNYNNEESLTLLFPAGQ